MAQKIIGKVPATFSSLIPDAANFLLEFTQVSINGCQNRLPQFVHERRPRLDGARVASKLVLRGLP